MNAMNLKTDDVKMGIAMFLKTATEADPVTVKRIAKKLRIAVSTVALHIPSVARSVGARVVRVREGDRGPLSKAYWVRK